MTGRHSGNMVYLKSDKTIMANRNYGRNIDKSGIEWCLCKYRYLVKTPFSKLNNIIIIQPDMTNWKESTSVWYHWYLC